MLRYSLLGLAWIVIVAPTYAAGSEIDYTRQIKPLLIKHCADCHGTDLQEGGFRVDNGGLVIRGGDRGVSVVANKPEESLLLKVLKGQGDIPQMPLELEPLNEMQIKLISDWIAQGAKLSPEEASTAFARRQSDHWAFQPISRPHVPTTDNDHWVNNGIDAFILKRLQKEGLRPSKQAEQATLIRRVYLDMLGIPPTPEQIKNFQNNDMPDAYDQLVDQVLSSPRYGERWGRHWLDLARYADSNGFTIDGPREIWKYRDWVINALNADMPFDQFTHEQMAGDLITDRTTSQLIATGFHRNTLINQEGGTSDEQFRVESVVDRVNTTGAIYLGLTVGCAQCHQHKYDPISQRDFYQLYAIFNNTSDNNDAGGSGPKISVPSEKQLTQRKKLQADLQAAEGPLAEHDQAFMAGFENWKAKLMEAKEVHWVRQAPADWTTEKGAVLNKIEDDQLLVDFSVPANDTYIVHYDNDIDKVTAIRLEANTHDSLPESGPGRAGNGNFVLSEFNAFITPEGGDKTEIELGRAIADHSQDGYPVYHSIDGKNNTGWAINVKSGSLNVDRQAIFLPAKTLEVKGKARLTITMFHNNTAPNYLVGCFSLSVTNEDATLLDTPESIVALLKKEERTKEEDAQIVEAYKQTDITRKELVSKVDSLKSQLSALEKSIPTTMVLEELTTPRTTHIQIRGDFLRTGAEVKTDVPEVLPPISTENDYVTRLDFSHWLMSDENPLTARVTVNRFWQQFYGTGLVETSEDFGVQGDVPTHPALLDWLAVDFVGNGWNVKRLVKQLVMTDAYRRSARADEFLLEHDPRNRYFARGVRYRLDGE
ncbi:MAG: PSD1 and planctomycete cytochrome C domain-containing protein, partial [Planctomycetota bacterium]|nr:PSD1 and planctomycete cytochrome C domain-containing protein [Planctomycetota bacterium]